MIFVILIGATLFSLVFRGLGGDDMVQRALGRPAGRRRRRDSRRHAGDVPARLRDGRLRDHLRGGADRRARRCSRCTSIDPVWLGIMMAMNLQTSYMHPPLGPTLFFLRGVAPPEITTRDIYVGIIPFVVIQLFALVVLWFVPGLATALPHALYGGR